MAKKYVTNFKVGDDIVYVKDDEIRGDVNEKVTSLEEDITTVRNAVNGEIASRTAQDAVINGRIDSANSAINELNGDLQTEITDRVNGDHTLDEEIAVERARIDAIVRLEPGSTTGDAELEDIRIEVYGNTALSAGAAVRNQVSNIYADINRGLNAYKLGVTFTVDGYVDYTNGTFSTNSFNGELKRSDYIRLPEYARRILNIVSHRYSAEGVAFYDADKEFLFGTQDAIIDVPAEAYYAVFTDSNLSGVHDANDYWILNRVSNMYNAIMNSQSFAFRRWGYASYVDGVVHPYGDGRYQFTDIIPVFKNVRYTYKAACGSAENGVAFYDSNGDFLSGFQNRSMSESELIVPENAAYFIISNDTNMVASPSLKMYAQNDINKELYNKNGIVVRPFTHAFFVDAYTGSLGNFDGYLATKYIGVNSNYDYYSNFRSTRSNDGIAFYDASQQYISGYSKRNNMLEKLRIPSDAKYFRVSCDTTVQSDPIIVLKSKNVDKPLHIVCYGDSTTEGMSLDGAGGAAYGKEPYPAHLQTMLTDHRINAFVNNEGIGGSYTQDIMSIAQCVGIFNTEELTLTANTPYSIGSRANSKLACGIEKPNGELYKIIYNAPPSRVNPLCMYGQQMFITIDNDRVCYLTCSNSVTIPKYSVANVTPSKNNDIAIIWAGLNGYNELTLAKWIEFMNTCKEKTEKYLIIGGTHPARGFGAWSDVIGDTTAEKHEYYVRECVKNFGSKFIDLYSEFFGRALDIALAGGFFSDYTQQQLLAIQTTLNNHVVPASFSYDGASEGNVHLNSAGYYVVATLVYERLEQFGWLER